MPHRWAHPSVATYVLGLTDEAGRNDFRAHLTACEPCRAEWLALRDVPPLLALVAEAAPAAGLDAAAWARARGHRAER